MEAGRELDALVAEKVMGWPLVPDGVTATAWPHVRVQADLLWVFETREGDWSAYSMRMFCPSEDIAAAWEVVETMHGRDVDIEIRWMSTPDTVLVFMGSGTGHTSTVPHAICLAALGAMGVEVPSTPS